MQTVTQQQAAIVRNQARIIDLLQWSPDEYSTFVYDTGLDYLKAYVGDDEKILAVLAPRKEFWNWWKNEWNKRDDLFVYEMDGTQDRVTKEGFRLVYRNHNSAHILASEIHPPKIAYYDQFTDIKMKAV